MRAASSTACRTELVEDVATEGMGPEALQAVLGRLYPTIQVRRDEGGQFYCLPD